MSSNTKHFIDNSAKLYSAENNRQFYGGANSFERGEIFTEKANELQDKVHKRFLKGPPKSPKNATARQLSLHKEKVKKWFKDSEKFDTKVKIWEDQAGLVKGSLSLEELDQLKASQASSSTSTLPKKTLPTQNPTKSNESLDSEPDLENFSSRPITASTPFIRKSALKKFPQDFSTAKPRRSSVRRVAFNDISVVNNETTFFHKENNRQSFLIDTTEPNRVLIASAFNPDQSRMMDITDSDISASRVEEDTDKSFRPFHLQTPNMIDPQDLPPDDLSKKVKQAKLLEETLNAVEITENYQNQIAAAENDIENKGKRRRNYTNILK